MSEEINKSTENGKPADFDAIKARATLVCVDPKGCWETIKAETLEPITIFKQYALPLMAAANLAAFIQTSIIGISISPFQTTWRAPFFGNLVHHVFLLLLTSGMLYAWSVMLQKLAPTFGGTTTFQNTFKLVVYSSTASWLAGILILLPVLGYFLSFAGSIYALYCLYQGIPALTGVPNDRRVGYFVVSFLVMMVVGLVVFGLLGSLMAPVPPINPDLQKIQENLQRMIPGSN